MELLRTEKDVFTNEEILQALEDYEEQTVPKLDKLWAYYAAKNKKILERKPVDQNNPDNKTVVSYGRKLVNTFQGYAYRPGYVTYKSENEKYIEELRLTFRKNNERVKTSRVGRDTGVYGVAYERLYLAKPDGAGLGEATDIRFVNVDPRQMIVYYDYAPEPKKMLAIHFFRVNDDLFKVEVLYHTTRIFYDRVKSGGKFGWELNQTKVEENWFEEIPVVDYFMGDERIGIIEPVLTLIDDYDLLTSDSMNEFDRFSNAYLLLKGFTMTALAQRDNRSFSNALREMKRKRVFEGLSSTDDVKFLLKDTPTGFITFLTDLVKEEIHKQSHVPDFMSEKLGGDISGVAVARLMFDFENLVSSAEGDFDIALMERIRLITLIYDKANRGTNGEPADISISHKRNVPQNIKEFAEIANIMKQAGFSAELIAEVMPDDIIPDPLVELERQKGERSSLFGDDVGALPDGDGTDMTQPETADVQAQALNGAQIKSMMEMVAAVGDKTMPAESVKALLLVAVPSLTREQANAIVDPAVAMDKPAPPPIPPQFGASVVPNTIDQNDGR